LEKTIDTSNTELEGLRIQVTKNWYSLKACKDPIVILLGGTRSGKSYAILQHFLSKLLGEQNKNLLITRKTRPALKQSAYKVFIQLLKEYGVYEQLEHNKSDLVITNEQNHNYLLFTGIDDEQKIKSTEWSYIFMEEANEFTYVDFVECNIRTSAPTNNGEINQLILALNPTDVHGWINKELIIKQGIKPIHSTYNQNPFLDKAYIEKLESLKEQDEHYWKIYGLGLFAEAGEIIYRPFIELDTFPESFDERIYGLDFGYNNESALIQCDIIDRINVYLTELLYETKLTNADLIERIKKFNISPSEPVYCDSSEPDRIEELRRSGINAIPAYKGKNSVKDGIDFCKRLNIHTLQTNVKLNEERAGYKWKKDRDERVHDEPVKWDDHLMDAFRYALYTHLANRIEPAVYLL
jgi:phage terminase large subunit